MRRLNINFIETFAEKKNGFDILDEVIEGPKREMKQNSFDSTFNTLCSFQEKENTKKWGKIL